MKNIIAAGALLACLGSPAMAGGEGWTSDLEAARKRAADEHKDLLIDFTGSDWCSWCIKLVDEVFSKDEFKAGVKDQFVLVEIDFPRDEAKLSEATRKQNEELQEKFGIQGFPTIVLADAAGRPYATTGYQQGGPVAYLKHLDELRARRLTRDAAFKKAAAEEGPAKAKTLIAALDGLPDEMIDSFFGEIVEQVKKADPADASGFIKQRGQKAAMATIEDGIRERLSKEDFDGALRFLAKAVDDARLEGQLKQQALAMKIIILANQEKFDAALTALEEVKALAPDSDLAQQLTQFRGQLEQAKQAGANKPADAGTAEPAPARGDDQPATE